ncbi:MAG: tetratricopeptide (TPR) repeat protein, partial [Chlamydiales bacterium]
LGAATYWVSIYFDGELLIPTLSIPLNLLALLLSQRHARIGTAASAFAAGLAWGLAAIARPNVLLFMPALACWFIWGTGRDVRAGLRGALVLALGVLAPILPLTVYNARVGHDRVLISTQAGVNLWIGNNPQADGSTAVAPGTRASWWGGYDDTIAQAEASEGRSLSASEVSAHYSRRALSFIFTQPSQSIPLLVRKLRLFWLDWELGNNQEVRFFAYRFNPWLRFTPLRFGLLAAAGLIGIALSRSRRASSFPLWGFLLVYMLSVVAFFINGRYRLPVIPILMIYGSYTLLWLYDRLRARSYGPAAALVGLLAAGSYATGLHPPELATDDSNGLWQLGVSEEVRGRLEAAERIQRDALLVKPDHPYARIALARVLARQERADEAITELARCVPGPFEVNAIEPLLDLLIDNGRLDQALSTATEALERRPALAVAHYGLGRVHVLRAEWDAARRALERAERAGPRDPRYAFGSAMALANLGQTDACLEALERAIELLPDGDPDHRDLGEQGFDNAIRILRETGHDGRADELERRRDEWRETFPAGVPRGDPRDRER